MQCLVATNNGTKAQIIEVLSMNFPLGAKKVYNMLRKRYQTSSTYTAVYQHMQELVDQGVVLKSGVEYMLDSKWINRLSNFADNTKINYSVANDFVSGSKDEMVKTLEFKSLKEFDEFLLNFRKKFIETSHMRSINEVYFLGDHTWGPLMNMRYRVEELKNIKQRGIKYHTLVRGSTQLDMYMQNFYSKFGTGSVKIGVETKKDEMIFIFNDIVIRVLCPSDIMEKIDKIFSTSKSIEDLNMIDLVENINNKDGNFIIIIIKDAKFAEEQKRIMDSLLLS